MKRRKAEHSASADLYGRFRSASERRRDGSLRGDGYGSYRSRDIQGSLPDLFKEGKGVVAQGKLQNGVFVADQVLAKHDENYMPPELKKPCRTRIRKLAP